MSENSKKVGKTFKDKIKERVSLVKQKSTELLLNVKTPNSARSRDVRLFVDSLIPELHQEIEIEQALNNYTADATIRETIHKLNERKKIEYDFFMCGLSENEAKKSQKESKKSNVDNKTNSPLDSIQEKSKSPMKIASQYFDLEINMPELLTNSLITKIDFNDTSDLFWNGTTHSIDLPLVHGDFSEDGLIVGRKPKINSTHVKAILSHSSDSSTWFDSKGELIVLDNPLRDFGNKEIRFLPPAKVEIATRFVEPEFILQNQKGMIRHEAIDSCNRILEIDFISLKFLHHSLFSLEHVLASKLNKYYEEYLEKLAANNSEELNKQLHVMRKDLELEKEAVLKTNGNNYKKVYKNENIQKKVREVASIRKQRFKEAISEKELEKNILKIWRTIKYVRKQLKFICTDVMIEISKKATDVEKERDDWETMFDEEVSSVLDEMKCEYFENKFKYDKEKKELNNYDKLKKPVLNLDEDKIKRRIFNEMCDAFRQPGDPILSFKLSHSAGIVTKSPSHNSEINRRNDVDKVKIFMKLYVNNNEICKTKSKHLNHDFSIKINNSYSIYIPENIEHLNVSIFEQTSMLQPNLIGEMNIKIPMEESKISKVKNECISFEMKQLRNYNNFGVGNCRTITEMVTNKLGEFKLGHLDVENIMRAEASVEFKIGWSDDGSKNKFDLHQIKPPWGKSNSIEKPTKEMLVKLFQNVLDPNDPKHTFLYTFMSTFEGKDICTQNFYLNDKFYFNFTRHACNEDYSLQNQVNRIDNDSQLVPFDMASVSGRISRTPRQSVLDDASFANRVLDPIDLNRRMSIRYLELVNQHLMMQRNKEKEKHVSDVLTFVEYHRIRNIRMDFLRPRQPLFHPSITKQLSTSLKGSIEHGKDYSLKMCILKAFQLPSRIRGSNAEEETGGLKMINLCPFVRVSCQGTHLRTSTSVGNNPTWNQQLFFTFKNEESSEITINLFDEIYEDLLEDDRLENSTVHCQYSANWLASLKIPLNRVVTQPKVEGIFMMCSPPEILGYKLNFEECYATTLNGLKRDINVKQKSGFYISLLLETYPHYSNDSHIPRDLLESNEMEYMIRYLNAFAETYENQYPMRKINLLVLDTSGKYVCITRFFKALPLPDFVQCIRGFHQISSNIEESEHSSKSSTPNRKKRGYDAEEITSQSIKSLLSGGDTGRQSKTTKEAIELRSLNDMGDDSERGLALKVDACVRFVSLIPLFQQSDGSSQSVVLTAYQTLRLVCGSVLDHAILLMSYFLQLDIECWCVSGYSLMRGSSSYVLVREKCNTNDMGYKNGLTNGKLSLSRNKQIIWKYFIYDPVTGVKYDTRDPFCPLQKVYCISNNENIWVNIQPVERCSLVRFNLNNTSDWRPVFQKQIMACPGPLPGMPTDEGFYSYSSQDVGRLRDAIEDKIRVKIQRWRGHRRTMWNRHCSSILRKSLLNWEKWSLNPSAPKPKISQRIQQLMLSYQMYGYPYNVSYTTIRDIILSVKATQIHLDEHTHTEYALAVNVFPYPNRVYSIWIYICTLVRKTDA